MSEICSKLTIKTTEHRSSIFITNFEQISSIVLVIPLLTLNKKTSAGISSTFTKTPAQIINISSQRHYLL